MKKTIFTLGLFFAAFPLFAQVSTNTPTDTPTDTPTLTTTQTATSTATSTTTQTTTNTATSTITNTPTVTATPTITSTPTNTFTITPTFTPTSTPTVTPTPGFNLFDISENILRPSVGPVTIRVGSATYNGPYSLRIYNSAGELIKILDDQASLPAAIDITYTWNGTNTHGDKVADGIYLFYLRRPVGVEMKKIAVVH